MTSTRPPLPPRPADGYPDEFFEAWTAPEDFEAYFEGTDDHSDFASFMARKGNPVTGRIRIVDEATGTELTPPAPAPMEFIGLRVPKPKVDHLDALAGDSKGGRSGVVRAAIDEYLERHPIAP